MLDFGISKNEYTPKLTQMGFVVGTTEYMAPEQFEHKVELKSDIWSLGVMTYEMLTGHLPFESNNPISLRTQIVKAKFTDPKILVPQISEKLSEVIGKSLKTSTSHRASAQELDEMLGGKPAIKKLVTEKPPGELKRFNKAINERYSNIPGQRKLIYGGVLVVVALVIIISFSRKSPDGPGPVNNPVDTTISADKPVTNSPIDKTKFSSVKIAVSNAANVEVVLPDASRKSVPVELTGKVGESYDVILKADGYVDKPVHISFLPTQSIYTYNLDKKTEE